MIPIRETKYCFVFTLGLEAIFKSVYGETAIKNIEI